MTENQYGEKISDVISNRDKFEPIEYNSESVCKDKVKLRKEIYKLENYVSKYYFIQLDNFLPYESCNVNPMFTTISKATISGITKSGGTMEAMERVIEGMIDFISIISSINCFTSEISTLRSKLAKSTFLSNNSNISKV